jgi:hypothetical protein
MSYSVAKMMKVMQFTLDQLAQPEGHAFVCSDLTHLWQLLFQKDNALRILIMYNGETFRETSPGLDILGRVDRHFIVVVSRGRGLNVERGVPLVSDTSAGGPALYTWVEKVRDYCRAMVFDPDWTERPVYPKNVEPFNTQGAPLIIDAYQINFDVGVQLGDLNGAGDNALLEAVAEN